jgi:hypothetical protein
MSDENHDEAELLTKAIIEFGFKFAEYVKEMDHDLWKRAIDYAKDWTEVQGVSFHYVKDEETDED